MKSVVLSRLANADLEEIGTFIAEDNEVAAIHMVNRLLDRCDFLGRFPNMGRRRDEIRLGYRSIAEDNYIIIYRPHGRKTVRVLRIVHAKRDLARLRFE